MNRSLHMAVNLTWECQLRCPICWIDDLGIDRESPVRDWTEWRDALSRWGEHALIDFSGGEPLLFPHFHKLMLALASANVAWAVTTNMLADDVVERFLRMPVSNCVSWNISYHDGIQRPQIERALQLKAAGYNVAINAVLHPSEPLPSREDVGGLPISWIPYQDWKHGGVDRIPRICNAGMQHIVMAPDGTVYRCQVELQKGLPPIGNVLTGQLLAPPSTHLCLIGCSTCYTQNANAAPGWRVAMEVAE